MTNNYKDIQRKVFSSEFTKFCQKNIVRSLKDLEKKRKAYINCIIGVIALGIIANFAYFYFIYANQIPFQIEATAISIAFIVLVSNIIIKSYKSEAKKFVLPKLISYIGNFKIVDKKNVQDEIEQYVQSLNLIDSFNRFYCDDCLEGEYKGVNLNVYELDLKYTTGSGKHRRTYCIFDGLFIKFKSFKKFSGRTVIKRDEGLSMKKYGNVVLEDPEFEKYFNVDGTDQIEARYLLTPAFMNRLVELKKRQIGRGITMSFEHGYVNIAVDSRKEWFTVPFLKEVCILQGWYKKKDWFEISISKPVTDITNYREIVLDLLSIFSIIDVLKMDQNIGM